MTPEFFNTLIEFLATLEPLQCAECLRPGLTAQEVTPVVMTLSAAPPGWPSGKRYTAELDITLRCAGCLAAVRGHPLRTGELSLPEGI